MTTVDTLDRMQGPEDEWWERAVIGAILQGYNDLPRLKRRIGRDDFAVLMHGYLWQLCVELDADGIAPTVAMVVQRLGGNAYRMPGGPVYLTDLAGSIEIQPAQAEYYATELRQCSLRRQGGQMGVRLVQMVQDPGSNPEDMLARNQEWLDQIRKRREGLVDDRPSVLQQVVDTAQNGEQGAPTTPWQVIDSLIGGHYSGAVTVVAARPGTGKSLWGQNSVTDLVRRHRLHALLISLEMTEYEITQRMLAHTAQVNLSALRAGKHHLNEEEWRRISRSVPVLEADRDYLTIHAAGGMTMLDIKAAVVAAHRRAIRADNRLALVVIDYIGRVRARDTRLNRNVHLGQVIDEIKDLAVQHEFASTVLAQLNRNPEGRSDKRPQMADVKDSGDIEQTADNLWLLHEEEVEHNGKQEKSGAVEAILAKQRNGPTGVRTLMKIGAYAELKQPVPQFPPGPHLSVVKD